MSIVTDIILVIDLGEDETLFMDTDTGDLPAEYPVVPHIDELNSWLEGQGQGSLGYVSKPSYGGKAFRGLAYIGSFGYFDKDGFIQKLESLDWLEPNNLMLLMKHGDESSFSVYVLGGSVLVKVFSNG